MSGKIGADLTQVLQSRSTSDQASTAALDGGTSAASAAEKTQQELVDISTTLRTGFGTTIQSLQTQFTTFRTTVNLSDWDGNTKLRANELVDRYLQMLGKVATEATSAVEEFGTQTGKEADALRAAMAEDYQGLTTQFSDRYGSLGKALQTYHDNLQTLDDASLRTS